MCASVYSRCFNINITVLQALVKLFCHECKEVMEMATAGCACWGAVSFDITCSSVILQKFSNESTYYNFCLCSHDI